VAHEGSSGLIALQACLFHDHVRDRQALACDQFTDFLLMDFDELLDAANEFLAEPLPFGARRRLRRWSVHSDWYSMKVD